MTQRRQQQTELSSELTVRQRLNEVALERDLRPSTRIQYQRCLTQLGVLDELVSSVTREQVEDALWRIHNPNTRRGAAICARSVLGFRIKIGKSVPRRYVLPNEDTLRLALMTSPHEVRGLLMLYCALRLGESCAVTRADLRGDRIRIDKQIQTLRETGKPTITRVAPVKSYEADVAIPAWLVPMVESLTGTAKPDDVRESIRRAGKKVGVDLNPHQLRHACATMLLERNVPMMVVSKHLRHSDIATTLRTYAQHDTSAHVHRVFG